ncbi:haloacid dehalogenase-like hydrolase [Chitinophaga jiangningensis]|uniref:Haloacid dehalogenase-like hydrolase n=1 Tax=Chitinophaga jiangningensis TaxID=1419482 RepID=A0A1M7C6L4_9BACT|nr:HAD family hydrolase [Chitinophaga jiangningensis]SHL62844.1 haloacid dehalogenase-like hydrolase [Chitinophaga jiangningensis]
MKRLFRALLISMLISTAALAQSDPLPSWNEGPVKQSIIQFVHAVTTPGTDFVPPADRIATFDNDGTLWAEKPLIQGLFAIFRVHRMVARNPALKNQQPYKAVIEKDKGYFEKAGLKEIIHLFNLTHSGMTSTAFAEEVQLFFNTVKHPTLRTSLYQAIYKPQLELLNYLRANGFKTFICSGGTVDFMRVVSDTLYGIPAEQVIGSELKYKYVDSAGVNDIMRLPGMTTFNDKQEKPVNIQFHIGKRPILACGNEGGAGDVYMLRFSQGSPYKSLQLIVNHDDAAREFEYGEKDNKSLNMAKQYYWQVISMKNDWNTVFP